MITSNVKQHIFVYGTLKPGFIWYDRLLKGREGVQKVGEAETVEPYALFADGIPFLLKEGIGAQVVKGFLLEVSEEVMLSDLDGLERHPTWYRREPIKVKVGEVIHDAWCYFLFDPRQVAIAQQKLEEGVSVTIPEYTREIAGAYGGAR